MNIKTEVKRMLKERGMMDCFNETLYGLLASKLKNKIKQDKWLKNYINLDPLNKAKWLADHLIAHTIEIKPQPHE